LFHLVSRRPISALHPEGAVVSPGHPDTASERHVMSLPARSRSRIGALAVAALALGGLVAATPASADAGSSDTSLQWGFRQSFRNYVGNPGNTAPQPIAPQSPATFDGAGSSVTRPYAFPVASGSIVDAQNFSVSFAGGVTYS